MAILSVFYQKQVRLYKNLVPIARFTIYAMIIMALIIPITPHLYLQLIGEEDSRFLLDYSIKFNWIVFGALISYSIFMVIKSNNDLKNEKYYKPININHPYLKDALKLALEMGIDINCLQFILFRDSSITPSIEVMDKKIAIILPRGFLTLIYEKPKTALAFLAHEYGHLLHRDIYLWRLAEILPKKAMKIVYPHFYSSLMLLVFFLIKDGFFSMPVVILSALPIILFISITSTVISIRKKSEFLADLASAVYVGVDDIKNAIDEYIVEDNRDGLHPSKCLRLDKLNAYNKLIHGKNSEKDIAIINFDSDSELPFFVAIFVKSYSLGWILKLPYLIKFTLFIFVIIISQIFAVNMGYVLYESAAYKSAYNEGYTRGYETFFIREKNSSRFLFPELSSCTRWDGSIELPKFLLYIPSINELEDRNWGDRHGYAKGTQEACKELRQLHKFLPRF